MREVEDFKTFNKILRKYSNRHCTKRVDNINGKKFTSYWEKEDWLGYRVTKIDQYTFEVQKYIQLMIGSEVMQQVHLWKFLEKKPDIFFPDGDEDDMLYFRGIMLTNRDAYAIIADAYGPNEYLYPIYRLITAKNNLDLKK